MFVLECEEDGYAYIQTIGSLRRDSDRNKVGTRKKNKVAKKPPAKAAARAPSVVKWALALAVTVGAVFLLTNALRRSDAIAGFSSGSMAGLNVLVITLDTVRADRLGCYGYADAETPVLDALAAEGIRFADAVAPASMTRPSHSSMFTGLDPPRHGVRDNVQERLRPDQVTLAETLKQEGYETAAFISAFVLDARFGLDQGFDHYDATVAASTGPTTTKNERPAGDVTDDAINWLTKRSKDKPFLAWVHYFDAHEPYRPPPPFASKFSDRPYDGEIAYVDSQVGRLLTSLERLDQRDRTLIVVVGDHGESLGEHGEDTHGMMIYESTQHVPLIVACRGQIAGGHVVEDVVVGVVDTFPTILDLLGVGYDDGLDGVSLTKAIGDTDRIVYIESIHPFMAHGWAPTYALRRHTSKYTQAPIPEYYDLVADPNELYNLLLRNPAGARSASAVLAADLAKRVNSQSSPMIAAGTAAQLDPATIARLGQLGYVSGGDVDSIGQPDPKTMMPTWLKIRKALKFVSLRQDAQAEQIAKEALLESPNDPSLFQLLGDLYLRANRVPEAEQAYRRFVELHATSTACVTLAQIIMPPPSSRYDEAERLLEQAVQLNPNDGAIYIGRGDLLAYQHRFEEALLLYQEAKRVDPFRFAAMSDQRVGRMRQIISEQ